MLATVLASLLLLAPAGYSQTEPDKTASRAQLLTTGRITKIDTKKRTLKVRTESEGARSTPTRQPQDSGRRSGTGGRGGRRNGGTGFPGGIPFPGGGGRRPAPAPQDQGKEFKVIVTDNTSIKDGDNRVSFLNLNVGDHISVQGLPKGGKDDLEATQITLSNR